MYGELKCYDICQMFVVKAEILYIQTIGHFIMLNISWQAYKFVILYFSYLQQEIKQHDCSEAQQCGQIFSKCLWK